MLREGPLAEEGQERELFLARLALEGDPKLLARWYAWRKPEQIDALSPSERLLYVQVERDDVEQAIDRALEAGVGRAGQKANSPAAALDRMLGESVAHDLARLFVPWFNPALVTMLDGRTEARQVAAWLLAGADDASLGEWLEDCEDEEHAAEAARIVGLQANPQYWDEVVAWFEAAESEGDELLKLKFQAALAGMDPVRYARAVVLGEIGLDWLRDPVLVADFLQAHGVTEWLETLALLEEAANLEATQAQADGESRKAFEFAALVAVGASAGVQEDAVDAEPLFGWLEIARGGDASQAAEKLSASGQFGFQVALGEDDDLVVLLCEAAIHEQLLALGEGSPGISGLPLSATVLDWVDREAAEALFASFAGVSSEQSASEEGIVALVHTLVDLRGWAEREPAAFAELVKQAVARFENHANFAVREACRRLKGEGDASLEALKAQSVREEIAGLDGVRQLVAQNTQEAGDALLELWMEGPLVRMLAVWDALGGGDQEA